MRVFIFSKNIPLPGLKENNIILRQSKLLESGGIGVKVFYPREFIPVFGKFFGERLKILSKLPRFFVVEGVKVSSLYYIRIPKIKMLEWFFSEVSLKLMSFKKINFGSKVDVIHSHYIFPDAILGHYYSKIFKVPHVVTIREGDYYNVGRSVKNLKIFNRIVDEVDAIVLMTPSLGRGISNPNAHKVIDIPSFIDDEYFDTEFLDSIKTDVLSFSCVSSFINRKNIDWLLEYFSKNKSQKIRLTICGDGPLFDHFSRISSSDFRINLTGYLNKKEIIKVLDQSDVFALPSDNESFGLVYAEAAARRNIVIGRVGTGLYGIEGEGFLFSKDKEDFFKKIDDICLLSSEELMKLKEDNFFISNRFSSKEHFRLLSSLYSSL